MNIYRNRLYVNRWCSLLNPCFISNLHSSLCFIGLVVYEKQNESCLNAAPSPSSPAPSRRVSCGLSLPTPSSSTSSFSLCKCPCPHKGVASPPPPVVLWSVCWSAYLSPSVSTGSTPSALSRFGEIRGASVTEKSRWLAVQTALLLIHRSGQNCERICSVNHKLHLQSSGFSADVIYICLSI